MNLWVIIAILVLAFLALAGGRFRKKRGNARLNYSKFRERWRSVGEKCHDQNLWRDAVIEADQLLDDALKKRGFKGGSMGERMVSARQSLTDNDSAWFAHKLRDKLVHDEHVELTRPVVQKAVKGARQALKDLGALR